MLKVFLVEDESVVREGLRDSIPWAQYGYEFSGDATDGEMALPQIRRIKPDILITDVKMPFMDGLALSKLVSAELPDTKIIIISGHGDFEFAREAIGIGVEQYLLKPITKASLLKTLEAVKKKIEEEREQKSYIKQFQLEAQEYEQYAQRKFFEQITSGALSVPQIYEQAKKLDIDIDAGSYNVVLFTVQPQAAASSYSQSLAELLEELMGFFLRYPEYLLFRCNLMTYAVLIKGAQETIGEISERCAENIQRRCAKGYTSLNWYVSIGEPVRRLSGLAQCFEKASQILSYRHFMPNQHILTSAVLRAPEASEEVHGLAELDVNKVDAVLIRSFLQTGLMEEVEDFASEYLNALGGVIQLSMLRQYIMLNVRINAAIEVKSYGFTQEEFFESLDCLDYIEREISDEELRHYIVEILQRAITLREKISGNQYRTILNRAIRFIDQNYTDENISLNVVAKTINISANYFSGIFSQEIGLTFVEYVTQKRMELAKQLLRQTSKRSGEIAFEVGYRDPRYFSFIFKKTQGCTPSSFRAGEDGKA